MSVKRIYIQYDSDIGPLDVDYDYYNDCMELIRIRSGGIDITQAITNQALLDELDYLAWDSLPDAYEDY